MFLLSSKKPFKRGPPIPDPFRAVRFLENLQRRREVTRPDLQNRPSRDHPRRLHARPWSTPCLASFSTFAVELPTKIRSAPALLHVGRLPERNPASSPLLRMLLIYPSTSTSRAKSGLKHACFLVALLPLDIDLRSAIRPQACFSEESVSSGLPAMSESDGLCQQRA